MSIYINYPFGGSGSGNDPTKLPLSGGTLTGLVYVSTNGLRSPLNQNFVIDAYNDTGAGTHNYFKFNPYGGGLELPDNSAGIKFDSVGGQNISKGSFDSGRGGYNGISLVCANNYELNWQSGYLKNVYNNSVADINVESKVVVNTGTGNVPLNLGITGTPTSYTVGDVWIAGSDMRFRDSAGTTKILISASNSNAFTTYQSITATNNSNPALKITQLGTGEALRVEDEASPDSTPFVISNSGRVGIGIAPDATVALTVDSTGIKVNGATLIPAAAVSNPPIISGNMSHSEYLKELVITINGVNYAIPLRVV